MHYKVILLPNFKFFHKSFISCPEAEKHRPILKYSKEKDNIAQNICVCHTDNQAPYDSPCYEKQKRNCLCFMNRSSKSRQ